MTQELQSLLEKIQRDGVEKAEAEAKAIVAAAREQAARIVADAKAEAGRLVETARKETETIIERGRVALIQGARDVILSIRHALDRTLETFVHQHVSNALQGDTLEAILQRVTEEYCQKESGDVTVLLPPELQEQIRQFFMTRFATEMARGLKVRGDSSVISGFKVSLRDGKIEHDFSAEAITAALCQVLRPHLAEIVRAAISDQQSRVSGNGSAGSGRNASTSP